MLRPRSLGFFVLILVTAVGCRPVKDPPIDVERDGGTGWYIPESATDPRILRIVEEDGREVEYFADRDEQGLPTAVTFVRVTDAAGETTTLEADGEGRIVGVRSSNGSQVSLTHSPEGVVAHAISPDGTQSFEWTLLDRPVLEEAPAAKPEPSRRKTSPFDVSLLVRVMGCGLPDPRAFVNVVWDDGNRARHFPTRQTFPGFFRATLPASPFVPLVDGSDLCEAIGGVVEVFCQTERETTMTPSECRRLASGFPPQYQRFVLPACLAVVGASEVACSALTTSPPGGESLTNRICNAAMDFVRLPASVEVTAEVVSRFSDTWPLPSLFSSEMTLLPGTARSIVAEFRGSERPGFVGGIEVEPDSLITGRSYTSEVAVACAPIGSRLVFTETPDPSSPSSEPETRRRTVLLPDDTFRFTFPGRAQSFVELDAQLYAPGEDGRLLATTSHGVEVREAPGTLVVRAGSPYSGRSWICGAGVGTPDWNVTYRLHGPDGPLGTDTLSGDHGLRYWRNLRSGSYSLEIVGGGAGAIRTADWEFDRFTADPAVELESRGEEWLRIRGECRQKPR